MTDSNGNGSNGKGAIRTMGGYFAAAIAMLLSALALGHQSISSESENRQKGDDTLDGGGETDRIWGGQDNDNLVARGDDTRLRGNRGRAGKAQGGNAGGAETTSLRNERYDDREAWRIVAR